MFGVRLIGAQLMRQGDQVSTCIGWWLKLLWNVCRLASNLVNMVSVKGMAANLYGARGEGHKAQNGSQK